MPMTNEELKLIVKCGVRRTLEAIERAHMGEHLSAYALCTDDDLRSVFHVAVTTEFCEQSGDPDIRYIPVDWTYDEGAEFLDNVNEQLVSGLESSSDFRQHVRDAFRCLVEALLELRSEGLFGDHVALIVTSTDPGPELESLADRAVRQLNSDHIYEEWREVMELS